MSKNTAPEPLLSDAKLKELDEKFYISGNYDFANGLKKARDFYEAELTTLRARLAILEGKGEEPMVENDSIGLVPKSTDAWFHTARQYAGDVEFYRNLVVEVGELFGDAAKTCDDGSIAESVLALKVPDLVRSLTEAAQVAADALEWQKKITADLNDEGMHIESEFLYTALSLLSKNGVVPGGG